MPLWEPGNLFSLEDPAMVDLADRFSECEAAQRLSGLDAVGTLAKIKICQQTDPWDENLKIPIAQLEEMLFQIDIAPSLEGILETNYKVGDPEGRCPDTRGTFEARVLRQVTELEFVELGPDLCYRGFSDCIAGLLEQLQFRADSVGRPTIDNVRRTGRALWNNDMAVSAQGRHLWALVEVDWGSAQRSDR